MNLRISIAFALLLTLLGAAPAGAAAASAVGLAHGFAPHTVIVKYAGERTAHARSLPPGIGVHAAARALRANPAVEYAAPDYIATASALPVTEVPDDPGTLFGLPGVPGGWVTKQWNFLPSEGIATPLAPTSPGGIDAIGAWQNLVEAKHPGAIGVTVAVLDTGIAYRSLGSRFRRSPDFGAGQFVKGHDFVAGNRLPLDRNGHGTHVAGTIAEKTDNGIGLTGLAFRAKLMPVRVLDRFGRGRADQIARGIRFATSHHADVINMSFNFGCHKRVPGVVEALHAASRKGIVLVASAGNLGSETCVSPPATVKGVIGVGGTTEGGCLGEYSLAGKDVDVVAPGGGDPIADCDSVLNGPIYQVTFKGADENRFGEPDYYVGTSMAAAHVSGVAAMILASGLVDRTKRDGTVGARVATRLKKTAHSIGLPATQEGAGLINAALATDPGCLPSCASRNEPARPGPRSCGR